MREQDWDLLTQKNVCLINVYYQKFLSLCKLLYYHRLVLLVKSYDNEVKYKEQLVLLKKQYNKIN